MTVQQLLLNIPTSLQLLLSVVVGLGIAETAPTIPSLRNDGTCTQATVETTASGRTISVACALTGNELRPVLQADTLRTGKAGVDDLILRGDALVGPASGRSSSGRIVGGGGNRYSRRSGSTESTVSATIKLSSNSATKASLRDAACRSAVGVTGALPGDELLTIFESDILGTGSIAVGGWSSSGSGRGGIVGSGGSRRSGSTKATVSTTIELSSNGAAEASLRNTTCRSAGGVASALTSDELGPILQSDVLRTCSLRVCED